MDSALNRAVVACVLVGVAACGSDDALSPEWPDLPEGAVALQFDLIDDVHTTQISGIEDRRRLVISTQEAWESFWTEFAAARQPQPEVPAIDFDQQMVIAATMGTRNTGGYGISVQGVFQDDGRLIVRVLEFSPGTTCATTQSITAPATAVSVVRSEATVEFQEATETIECT